MVFRSAVSRHQSQARTAVERTRAPIPAFQNALTQAESGLSVSTGQLPGTLAHAASLVARVLAGVSAPLLDGVGNAASVRVSKACSSRPAPVTPVPRSLVFPASPPSPQ